MPDSKHTSDPTLEIASVDNHKRRPFVTYLLYSLLLVLSSAYLLNTIGSVYNNYSASLVSHKTNVSFDWKQLKPSPELRWNDCFQNRQCARLEVPLDYNNPTGEKAAIAMLRIKAKTSPTSKKYRGPILFNPGGPGNAGVAMINTMGESFQKLLGEEYDIVGFDPRGVGVTTPPVAIFSDQYERASWDARTPPLINSTSDSFIHAYTRGELLGELAAKRTMHAAAHVSTATVARDMLTITQAHGRDKLMYWGFSYGTVLGAIYAALYPDNIERLVIDGVADFDDYYSGSWSKNLYDTDKILQLFYNECAAAGLACPLYANSSSLVQRRVEEIFMAIQVSPLAVVDGTGSGYGVVDHSMLKRDFFTALYSPFTDLNQYAHILAAVERGDGRLALTYNQKFHVQPKCNSEPTLPIETLDATAAIMCGEGQAVNFEFARIARQFEQLSQVSKFADVLVERTTLTCARWEIKVKNRYDGPFNSTTRFPLLIIGNTMDPVTPLVGAKKASHGFKDSVLLTIDTPGHCSYAATSPSAMKHVRRYFREGLLPPPGTVCEIEEKLFGIPKEGFHAVTKEDKAVVDAARAISRYSHGWRGRYLL